MGLKTTFIFGALFGVIGVAFCLDGSKIVATKQGRVEGNLASNGLYYEFLGIRYGTPVKFRVSFILVY